LSNMQVLCFDYYAQQSHKLARALNASCHTIQVHRFPDGESKLTLPANIANHVVICSSLDHPNEKLVELMLAAKTARKLGAKTLTLVAPYLCYMRQDIAFQPGEAVSQTIIGDFLAKLFDNIITVDPHLHRIHHLQEAVPTKNAISLSATTLMADYLHTYFQSPVLLAPDSEAEQWVKAVAAPNKWEYGVCNKIRSGDKQVEITLPDIDLNNREVIIVDDVASSGRTLAVAIQQCLAQQAKYVDVLITHALFSGDAKQCLVDAGVRHIWSTDSVTHESNVIALDGLLKEAILKIAITD
jgi:ribose-phosphate pyrophosphokinase